MISWRQIEAFRAVMLTRSMTDAAHMLSVTQPAVSRLIQEFEFEAGFSLFSRRKGGLLPSTEASRLFEEVQRSFKGRDNIESAITRIRNRQEGVLRVAAMPAMTPWFLPKIIKHLLDQHDGLAISLQTHNSPTVADLVRDRSYDVGFAMTPVDTPGLEVGEVQRARCVCVLPKDHRLVRHSVIDLHDLEGESFISLAEGTTTRMKIDAAFTAANVRRRLVLETRTSATVCGMVLHGLGVGIIEPFSAISFAERGGIVRPLLQEIDFSFVRILSPGAHRPAALTNFLELVDRYAEPHLAPPDVLTTGK
ncbi:LysR substrate-binding domain-containing protein [Chelativorans sp. YIM 93263]|uniref:LysR substrate-binding domain-containing protein n=1 Tax=Chelativorans sp. YIM 93263 TaxID=2906648 RepID=UPI0023783BC7|nr:LysR substrate-binding domain-containing protein [Chelativorans sp. YIM 93263]